MSTKSRPLPLAVYNTRDFTGLHEMNHLSNAYLVEPEVMDTVLSWHFGFRHQNIVSLITGGLGNTHFVTNRQFEWYIQGQTDKAIECTEISPDAGNGLLGYGGTPFRIILAEKWFDKTDLLRADDDETVVRVQEEPVQYGSSWAYTVVCTTRDEFLDPSLTKPGARWSKEYSPVEEFSKRGGSFGYVTPYKLRNCLTTCRMDYPVTREASKAVTVMELPDPQNPKKTTKVWTKVAEWTAMAKWYQEMDRLLLYSKYNKDPQGYVSLKGDNERPVYLGAGLREQISPANKRYYNSMSYELLDEVLLDLSYVNGEFGGHYHFMAMTGKMGMREFDKAIKEYARGNNITVTDNGTFITGKGSDLTLTGYFKTVEFMNGIKLTVKEIPHYDNFTQHRLLHPVSKYPTESYRFTIFPIGKGPDGKSIVQKVAMKDSENAIWHTAGSTDPMGTVAKSLGKMRSSSIDGYEVHMLAQCGIQLRDPERAAELIFRAV